MSSRTVIYHGPTCHDGFCAAWLIHRYLDPEATFIPAQYGDPAPDVTDRDVLILDFSYPRETLETMYGQAKSLVVLDHHVSAKKELVGLPYCRFDIDLSGAQMTWEWLADQGVVPDARHWLVDYTGDRDLWRWTMPWSRPVNAAIRSYPLDFAVWDGLAEEKMPESLVPEGQAILRAEGQIIADHVARAREVVMDGYRVRIVNASCLFSDIAGTLAEGYPFGAVWFVRPGPNGPVRQWSLRSRDDGIDVSELAKRHGGGGHPKAAGYEEPASTPLPPYAEES